MRMFANKKLPLSFFLLILFLVVVNFFVWLPPHSPGLLKVAFLSVGQGDAIYIETPGGRQVLIDGGPDAGVLRELGKVMPFWDRSLDLVLESHSDSDHIGGLPDVLERFSVKNIIDTTNKSDSKLATSLGILAEEKNDPEIKVRAGERIILDNNVYLDILSPAGDPTNWETNKASLVVKLTYASTSFLFTGDIDESVEKYLTVNFSTSTLHADVLKVSHHGSRNSNNPAFLAAVSPVYSVISVGPENKFGHPHQEVLYSLSKLRSQILRTDQVGMIEFESNGRQLTQVK